MRSLVLFEDEGVFDFLPLTYWRTLFEVRVGRKIILDRTAQRLGQPVAGVWVRDGMSSVAAQRCGAPVNRAIDEGTVLVSGRWVFDEAVTFDGDACVGVVGDEIAFVVCDKNLASKLTPKLMLDHAALADTLEGVARTPAPGRVVRYPWELIAALGDCLRADFHENDAVIESDVAVQGITNTKHVHISERCAIHPTAIIDATNGPVFISHDVTIGAYAVVEGPSYVGPGCRINPHAWLHGANALGPVCRVGGEMAGCIMCGYSNKQHAGFLGHSYVGSWVNLGAGCTNSNLKNTYGPVRVPIRGVEVDSGLAFFGAIIGDHAKVGINTAIPTGAVFGFAAGFASRGEVPKFLPSFGWHAGGRLTDGDPRRLLDVAIKAMARRDVLLTDDEAKLFLDLPRRASALECASETHKQ